MKFRFAFVWAELWPGKLGNPENCELMMGKIFSRFLASAKFRMAGALCLCTLVFFMAVVLCRPVLAAENADALKINQKGISAFQKGDFAEAIADFREALRLAPQDSVIWGNLGDAYRRAGNPEEALKAFNKALSINPDNRHALLNRGWTYYAKNDVEKAGADASKILILNSKNVSALLLRAWSHYRQGKFHAALGDFNRGIELIEADQEGQSRKLLADNLVGKAFTYAGLGDSETAVRIINGIKETETAYHPANHLSLIYYAAGNKEKAWEYRGGRGMIGLQIKDYHKGSILGAEVVRVVENGPAQKAGILPGDVLIKLGDADIHQAADFLNKAKTLVPDSAEKLKLLRAGTEKEILFSAVSAEPLMEENVLVVPLLAARKAGMEPSSPVRSDTASPLKTDIDESPAIVAQPRKNAYAIVIGIERYRQNLPKADFAVNDAKLVRKYLVRTLGVPEENVVLLTDDHASKSDFEKYFERWLSNNVEKGGRVFVYYSGHGAPNPRTGDAYLVPYDGDPSFIAETGYSLKRMYDALGKLPAGEIVVVLDSCFSGAGGRSVLAKGARPLVMNVAGHRSLSKNMTVLSASSGEQISSTYQEKAHGLFTYFLLKGIRDEHVVNADGSLKTGKLFEYLKPRVESIARKQYNNEQTPQLLFSKD